MNSQQKSLTPVPRGKSLNDVMLSETKALAGGIPFQSQGYGASGGAIYSSWDAWDRLLDRSYYGGRNDEIDYAVKIGDPSRSSLVMAAIRFLSNVLPEAKLQVKENKGTKGDSVVVKDHPAVKLWDRPNKHYSGSTLTKAIAFSWVLKSEAYIIKFFNEAGSEPVELWYEPHWTIRPVWPIDGSEFISHYEVNRNGSWLPLPIENVIHLRDGINPYNPRSGLSGIDSILREVFGDMEAARYYAHLMEGSAVPPFVVAIDKDVDMAMEDVQAFQRDLINKTTGDKKGQPIVVKGGTVYKLAFSPQELDLRESRYMPEDRFCAVMGIPAVVMELGSGQAHSIYNNVKQAMERAWTSYVKPLLNHMEEELNIHLLEDFEGESSNRYFQHDLSKVQALQEDQDAKVNRLSKAFTTGGITRAEFRSGMDYGPSDPKDPTVDDVFAVSRGVSLVKPGEDPEATPVQNQPGASLDAGPGQPKGSTGEGNEGSRTSGTEKTGAAGVGNNKVQIAKLALAKSANKKSAEEVDDLESNEIDNAIRHLKRLRFDRAVSLIEKAG